MDKNNKEANISEILTSQEDVIRAEIIQVLKVVDSNYSFFLSTTDDGDRFRSMFPDSNIAKQYPMSRTNVGFVIKHGISPIVEDHYIQDFKSTPFVLKFDETTTIQNKKQYDGYVQFWSAERNLVTSVYSGSVFVGHCRAKDLFHHFNTFGQQMKWEPDLLLQVGMDESNVNLKFVKDLARQISDS